MEKINCAIILAGGVGNRLFPISNSAKPKQFLNLYGNKTMIQYTYDRINKIIEKDKIFIVTLDEYKSILKEQIPGLSDKNIITEPQRKNTAPCILLSLLYIRTLYNDANIIVLPSDHRILNLEKFNNALKLAFESLKNKNESIIVIGKKPTRAETGYGYIKYIENNVDNIFEVEKFVEKPSIVLAKKYLNNKLYLWNCGITFFDLNYMLGEYNKKANEMYKNFKKLFCEDYNMLSQVYNECDKISFENAIIEKLNKIYVIKAKFDWDDLGSYESLNKYKDNNNIYV